MAFNITLPDDVGAALMALAAARNESPEMVIREGLLELERRPAPAAPLSEAEFNAVLGITPEMLPEIKAQARKLLEENH